MAIHSENTNDLERNFACDKMVRENLNEFHVAIRRTADDGDNTDRC